MIYEIRTYRIAPGSLAEVEKRYGEAYEHRKKYSELTAFWHTEIGPLNEVVHVGLPGSGGAGADPRSGGEGPELAGQDSRLRPFHALGDRGAADLPARGSPGQVRP